MTQLYGPSATPGTRRGIIPLILAALAAGKGIYGAVQANQQKQRNKGLINDAYRTASARMGTQQSEGTESNEESLNQRGLLGGGMSPIRAALSTGETPGATDIAGASRSRLAGEYALDRHALDAAHEQSLNENKADALNAEIGSLSSGIQGVAGAYGTGQDLAAIRGMNAGGGAAGEASPIRSALLSGSSWEGVHPTNPLGDATSSWHTPNISIDGSGIQNSSFNTSGLG